MAAFNFKVIRNQIMRKLFEDVFNTSSGHDHDGTNSKAVTVGTVGAGLVTNTELATDVKVGSLAALTTTEKGSVVGAINELEALTDDIGSLATLTTTAQTTIVAAINEVDASAAAAAESAAAAQVDATAALATVAGNVTLTGTETLTNKTLTTPVVASVYQDAGKTKLMTIPNSASDTLAAIAAEQTLTNKTLTTPIVASFYQDAGKTKLMTTPNVASDTIAVLAAEQTFTNKTLTTPIIASAYQDAGKTKLMSLPNTASDTLCAIAATQTLTNKVLSDDVQTWTLTAHDYGGAAEDWTLSAGELLKPCHKPTNANAPVNAIVADTIRPYLFINGTGQNLTVKTAAGTGITIANGKAQQVMSDGVNVIAIAAVTA